MVYSISDISSKMKIEERTLKFYAKEGLLPLVERTASGHLKFQERDFEWLDLLSWLRITGASLSELKEFAQLYYQLATSQRPNPIPLYHMLSEHMHRAEEEMRAVQESLNHLTAFIEKTGDGSYLTVGGIDDGKQKKATELKEERYARLAKRLQEVNR